MKIFGIRYDEERKKGSPEGGGGKKIAPKNEYNFIGLRI